MMEEELISKKDLLRLTGISYGQLYRWKRKNLIPEEWFIRKSTFTGQETFFPKQRMLARIDKILGMKEERSLDELADLFSPWLESMMFQREELIQRNIVSLSVANRYFELIGEKSPLSIDDVLAMLVLEDSLASGELTADECSMLLQLLHEHMDRVRGKEAELILLRKLGISIALLSEQVNTVQADPGSKLVKRISLLSVMEQVKIRINEWRNE